MAEMILKLVVFKMDNHFAIPHPRCYNLTA